MLYIENVVEIGMLILFALVAARKMFHIIGNVFVSAKSAMVIFRASTVWVVMFNKQNAEALLWGIVSHGNHG